MARKITGKLFKKVVMDAIDATMLRPAYKTKFNPQTIPHVVLEEISKKLGQMRVPHDRVQLAQSYDKIRTNRIKIVTHEAVFLMESVINYTNNKRVGHIKFMVETNNNLPPKLYVMETGHGVKINPREYDLAKSGITSRSGYAISRWREHYNALAGMLLD